MKNSSAHTPSNDYELYSLKQQVKALREHNRILETENTRLLRDIDHLTNLSIPLVSKELGKSVQRSVKFRVTRAIWGKDRFYQPNEEMTNFTRSLSHQKDAEEALRIIQENDAENVVHLSNEPSNGKVVVYETVRKLSHAPRRIVKMIKRKTVK